MYTISGLKNGVRTICVQHLKNFFSQNMRLKKQVRTICECALYARKYGTKFFIGVEAEAWWGVEVQVRTPVSKLSLTNLQICSIHTSVHVLLEAVFRLSQKS